MKFAKLLLYSCLILLVACSSPDQTTEVFFTNGLKIGDVSQSSAVILTRLCASENPTPIKHERREKVFRHPIDFDDEMPVEEMDGAVKGSEGQVKFELVSADTVFLSEWMPAKAEQDFMVKTIFNNLTPQTGYKVIVHGRKDAKSPESTLEGRFTTAPNADKAIPVFFTSSTCQYFWSYDDEERGFKIYDSMSKLKPLFHCQTGDYIYYDKPGPMVTNIDQARHKWHAMNSRPSLRDFYLNTPLYQQKDDHDLLVDDAGPSSPPLGDLTYEDGLKIWREQVAIVGLPFRTFRWGKDLQIWSVEGREYRSDNKSPDGIDKTIWGQKQIDWFKETVESSNATFKILVSPTPVVGPDRAKGKYDNHSNESFKTEGEWLREYLADQNVFVINGDRHWQYVSVDPKTGLREFSQGPVSTYHAQGWKKGDKRPQHKFLRVDGGFLGVRVHRPDKEAVIEFIHYDVDGREVNKEIISELDM